MRKVSSDGAVRVGGQRLLVGYAHVGKHVTVVVEDTVLRVLLNEVELCTHIRKTTKPITHVTSAGARPPKIS
jgi:acyl-[acyl carrier protein]--UDP-N-acetylglucosamine O-acyltransferase